MKKAREKWLKKGRREKEERDYNHKRKEAHKITRNKKKVYMKNVIESIEEDQNKLLNRVYELVRQILEEEMIPEEWTETITVPIHKRGDRVRCKNYRGIALGNAAYKILSDIILGNIEPYIEKIMGDYQNGFRDGRSVIDNIFALKIINKKLWEYNQSIRYLFIDFQRAYDFIHTDTIWKCMEEFKIPTKLINICKTCIQKTRSAVRIEGTLSSFFENKTGLKQGDPLSPTLFNLALQKVIQSIEIVPTGTKIDKEQMNILEYADDIVLIGKKIK